MTASTFSRFAVLLPLALGACTTTETAATATAPSDPGGWLMFSGKQPTKAEFAALAATCEEMGGAVDSCFTNLGLKRAQ
jgi:hypothetical protein